MADMTYLEQKRNEALKVIETEYNGYKFRSRLEARWAIFFDAAGIEYQYHQSEDFELEDGTKYLPDFYLPELNLWVEIKPKERRNELERVVKFCKEAKTERILWLQDIPPKHDCNFWWYPCFYYDTLAELVYSEHIAIINPQNFICRLIGTNKTRTVPFCVLWERYSTEYINDSVMTRTDCEGIPYWSKGMPEENNLFEHAYDKARQVCFEQQENIKLQWKVSIIVNKQKTVIPNCLKSCFCGVKMNGRKDLKNEKI